MTYDVHFMRSDDIICAKQVRDEVHLLSSEGEDDTKIIQMVENTGEDEIKKVE